MARRALGSRRRRQPREANLQRDLTNLRLAQFLRARCLLVADIERGGVFAQVVGTLALLRPIERPLIRGILINRFRGRRELFDDGRAWLERETGIPVVGVMPWLNELFPPEDSLDLLERRPSRAPAELEIAVLRLPSLSNFSDLDPLEAEASVRLRWISPGESLGHPDAVILHSKQTLNDLALLREGGLSDQLKLYANSGGNLLGLCGGLQMLGRQLDDPEQLEGGPVSSEGLGLLPIKTRFSREKTLQQRDLVSRWPAATEVRGFELHHGRTMADDDLMPLMEEPCLGWWKEGVDGGVIAGSYLHGLLDNGPWRRHWLNHPQQGLPFPPIAPITPRTDQLLDRLADAFEHVDVSPLLGT